MTAVAGIWRFDGRPDAADGCARMLTAQEIYGPDDGAQWSDGGVALGLRLMRVLPEDAFDDQPLIGGEGRFALVADVRLDNRDELTEALGISASQARGLGDAAILLAAFERWDESCLDRITGDYAFAVWDSAGRRLVLARDPLGQRSLHYHRGNKFFAFASMPKGLHALPEIPYAPNEERIAEFLVHIPETGTQSFFLGIERVEPGHVVTVTVNGLTTRRHWQPSESRIKLGGPEEYSEALRHLLDQAVQCRLRGTGDVTANLSGGFDSGAVVATAARLLAPTGRQLIAMTGAPREGYDGAANGVADEAPYAAATAALYPNVEHIVVRNSGRSPLDDLDRTFFLFDRPVFNLCTTGLSYDMGDIARKRNLRVLLGGGFGNWTLSYHGIQLLPELFVSGQWLHLLREARALVASGQLRWRAVFARTFGPWCPPILWIWLNKIAHGYALEIGSHTSYTAINSRRLAELDLRARARARGWDLAYRPGKNSSVRFSDMYRVDPGNFRKGGMGGWQLDFRDPTADVRLIEFCLRVPTEQFLRDGVPRALARRALADRLPREVLEEPRGAVAGADWHENLTAVRGRVVEELDRLAACPAATRAVDLPRLRRLTENWPSGGWERDDVRYPYRYALLRGISAGHFLRRATGSNR